MRNRWFTGPHCVSTTRVLGRPVLSLASVRMPSVPAFLRPFLPRVPMTRADLWLVSLMWVAGVEMGWSQGVASALIPYSRADLGLTEGGMSLVLAVARLAAVGSLVLGFAADRSGRRRPLLVALTLLLVATVAAALAPGALSYGASQAAVRIGGAAVASLAVVITAEGVTPGVRAYAISFFGAAASLGAGLSVLTLPLAEATGAGWRLPHALPALIGLLLPFLWKRLPESPLHRPDRPALPWRALLQGERRRRFLLLGGAGLLASAFTAVGLAFTTERLIGDLGYSPGTAVLVTVGGGTAGAVGFLVGGRLADVWGRRPTSILALMLALAGGLLLYRLETPMMLAAAAALSAFGSFAYIPAGGAHRAELFPTTVRAGAGTAANYLATIGSAAGLLVGTLTIDRLGLTATVTWLGLGMVAAALLTSALPETLGQDLADVA